VPYAALIFDYGNVLSLPQDARVMQTMANRLEVSLGGFRAAYEQQRDSYDTAAITAAEYWQQVLRISRRSSMASSSLVEWLIDRDAASWTQYREEMWDLARSFRLRGHRIAILSNCPYEILARIRADRPLESSFDVLVFSCEVGVAKPATQIYQTCIMRLGVKASDVLFVDDIAANIDAATRLGWHTYQFAGANPLRDLQLLLNKGENPENQT